jgi:hypothetical protein
MAYKGEFSVGPFIVHEPGSTKWYHFRTAVMYEGAGDIRHFRHIIKQAHITYPTSILKDTESTESTEILVHERK